MNSVSPVPTAVITARGVEWGGSSAAITRSPVTTRGEVASLSSRVRYRRTVSLARHVTASCGKPPSMQYASSAVAGSVRTMLFISAGLSGSITNGLTRPCSGRS